MSLPLPKCHRGGAYIRIFKGCTNAYTHFKWPFEAEMRAPSPHKNWYHRYKGEQPNAKNRVLIFCLLSIYNLRSGNQAGWLMAMDS